MERPKVCVGLSQGGVSWNRVEYLVEHQKASESLDRTKETNHALLKGRKGEVSSAPWASLGRMKDRRNQQGVGGKGCGSQGKFLSGPEGGTVSKRGQGGRKRVVRQATVVK